MPDTTKDRAAGDPDSRQRCSCLPFCFWGGSGSGGAQAKTRRRRRRLRLRLRLSWLTWPWFRKSGGKKGKGGDDSSRKGKKKRLLLLLTTSLQPKKALASVVSGDGALPPVPAKVSSFDDAKRRSNRRPPRPAVDDATSGGSRQPTTPRPRPESTSQPSPRPTTDGPTVAGRTIWRAPSRRHSFHHQPDGCSSSGSGLWTAATTLGVTVLFGRVTAVVFLCSCLYAARFVRAWAAGAKPQSSGVGSSSRRFGGPVGVAGDKVVVAEPFTTEECRKKVVMAGLLDRAGKTPSLRFGR